MTRAIASLLLLCLLLPASPAPGRSPEKPGKTVAAGVSERTLDPAGCAASMMNFLEKGVAARYPRFKNRIDMAGGTFENGRYTLNGSLYSDKGRPMQLFSEFIEAVEGTKLVRSVYPRHAKRGEENQNRLAFVLQIDADPAGIPWDPVRQQTIAVRQQTFAVKVPAGASPVAVKIELAEGGRKSVVLEDVREPGTTVEAKFKISGPAKLRVSFDGVPFRTFDLE